MKFGSTIKQLRSRQGINQQVLAERIGVTQTYLSLIESDRKTPSINLINSLSKELKIPPSILAYLTLNKVEIPNNKHETFDKINPLIEGLIKELLINDENSES
ncbi:MAG: helix-turn-helix transcriptional regulator [Candidatus Paceibacterota bacterium]